MKRVFLVSLSILLFTFSLAQVNENDITMVSFEQGWLDSEGTLALKNNTDKDIQNVVFQITYLDMAGNPLDYKEFSKEVEIAPGKTRKLDIPAYEHGRRYHYYRSENSPIGSPAFKVKFELKNYNTDIVQDSDNELSDIFGTYSKDRDDKVMSELKYTIIGLIAILLLFGAWLGMYIIVAVMAQKRNRSVVAWVLLSMIASPLLMIIILLIVGEDNGRIEQY